MYTLDCTAWLCLHPWLCMESLAALLDALLPFQWVGFLSSYLCALSTHPDRKSLVGLLAEVMERVPLIRTGPESDPSFFLAVTWDTFIVLDFFLLFVHQNSPWTFFLSLSKSSWKKKLHFKKCLPCCYLFHSLFPDFSCALSL